MAVLSDAPLAYVRFLGSNATDVTGRAQVQRSGVTIVDGLPSRINARAGVFAGSDWLSIAEMWGTLLGTNAAVGTFEAWVKLGPISSQREALISSDLAADTSWVAVWASAEGLGFSRYIWEAPLPGRMDAGAMPDAGFYEALNTDGVPPIIHAGTDQAFHHVVATFGSSGCRMTLYVDGSVVGSNANCVNLTQWPRILVGAATNSGTDGAHATIAEIAIYGSGLSPGRVLAHYQAAAQ